MHVLLRIVDHLLNVAHDVIDELPKSQRVLQGQVVVSSSTCCVQVMNKSPDDLILVNVSNGHLDEVCLTILPFNGGREREPAGRPSRPSACNGSWGGAGEGTLGGMIHGAHVIVYSKDADADRAFFRDVLKYESVDAGHGWLIFALPPAEVAVHPSEENDVHEFFLMCDDVHAFIADMKQQRVECSRLDEQRWGSITRLTLPGGGKLGVYQPKHASPLTGRAT
ncbi:MAG: hypothetical protein ABIT71_09135 [Vicinamibacteraceae bacterium]